MATIIGIYTQLNVSQHPARKVYNGRVYILTENNEYYGLETGDQGIRSKWEIFKYNNTKVEVEGTLFGEAPLWGSGEQASIVMKSIKDITSLKKR